MKRIICLTILLSVAITNVFGQVPENIKKHYCNTFEVFTDLITAKPDNFTPKAINMGYSFSITYLVPVGKSDFSFSLGGAMTWHNFYSDAVPKDAIPTDLWKDSWNDYYFMKLDSLGVVSYTKNKMCVAYVGVPVELFYCAKNGIRFTAGMRLDFKIASNTKYNGTDFLYGTTEVYKYKKYNLQNLSNFGLCPVVRVGWRWFNVYASYSLISVYEASVGNKIKPISLGISFTPGR